MITAGFMPALLVDVLTVYSLTATIVGMLMAFSQRICISFLAAAASAVQRMQASAVQRMPE